MEVVMLNLVPVFHIYFLVAPLGRALSRFVRSFVQQFVGLCLLGVAACFLGWSISVQCRLLAIGFIAVAASAMEAAPDLLLHSQQKLGVASGTLDTPLAMVALISRMAICFLLISFKWNASE
ncbi:hypothetical protein U1Q18_008132 [Sarracenia purpurea var. burkii]